MNHFPIVVICVFALACVNSSCSRNDPNSSAAIQADPGNSVVNNTESNAADGSDEPGVDRGPKKTAIELTANAITKMRNGDTDGALLSVQAAVALDENYFDARWHLLVMLHERGIERLNDGYKDAGYDDLVSLNKHALWMTNHLDRLDNDQRSSLAVANYNAACAFAQRNFTDKAIASLTRAFALGFDNFDQVKVDTDLDPLRELDEFKSLLQKHQQEEQSPDPDASEPKSQSEQ